MLSGESPNVSPMKRKDREGLRAFGDRLREARLAREWKQEYVATKVGVSGSYITKLENGEQPPDPELLEKLAKLLHLDIDELAFLIAPATAERVPELYRRFIRIVPLPEAESAPRMMRSGTRAEGRFPLIGVSSCGPMIEAIQQDRLPHGELRTTEPWADAIALAKSKRAFAVKAEGASMEPTIHDGDEVLIDPRAERTNGCIVLAQIGGDVTLKRWKLAKGVVILTPDNPDRNRFPEEHYSGDEWDSAGGGCVEGGSDQVDEEAMNVVRRHDAYRERAGRDEDHGVDIFRARSRSRDRRPC